LTTNRLRSFAGPGLAPFASTLVVCAGLVFLMPAPVLSDHEALIDAASSACAASPDPSRDHQWTDDVAVEAPDSCDDDGGDDDGDDDAPDASGQALSAGQRGPASLEDARDIVHLSVDVQVFRPLSAHSLRGPPALQQESSDADVDDDDDDDDESLRTPHSVSLVAADSRDPHVPVTVDAFHAACIGSGHALRAPPQ
jgi:hypothetical protein